MQALKPRKSSKIFYSLNIVIPNYDLPRRYVVSMNDPSGRICDAINAQEAISVIVDFSSYFVSPAGVKVSDMSHTSYSIRFEMEKGEDIRAAIARLALKTDIFRVLQNSYNHKEIVDPLLKNLNEFSKI